MLLKSLRNGKEGIPMKRMIRTLTLAALAACLLTVSALADSGPKDLLTVKVTNAPEGLYSVSYTHLTLPTIRLV